MKQDYRVDRADGATTYFAFTDTTDDSILRDIGLSDSELFRAHGSSGETKPTPTAEE